MRLSRLVVPKFVARMAPSSISREVALVVATGVEATALATLILKTTGYRRIVGWKTGGAALITLSAL
jgi:hypothetical protein